MCRLKTSALLGFCAEAGAIIGMRTRPLENCTAQMLREAFEDLGLAFQLRDDWLGLYGDQAVLGKPVGSDLAAGKPTILMLAALGRLEGPERSALVALLRGGKGDAEQLRAARALVTRSGAEAEVCDRATALAYKAICALRRCPDTPFRSLLVDLADYAVSRAK
jgi:geranylgeranyl diphosphate synthase type I